MMPRTENCKLTRDDVNRLIPYYYGEILMYSQKSLNKDQIKNGVGLEIAQATFLAVLSDYHKYDPDRGSFRTWLYAISRKKQADYFRRRRRAPLQLIEDASQEELYEIDYISRAEAKLEAQQLRHLLMQQLRHLLMQENALDRMIFFLRLCRHKAFQEISDLLGLPLSVVKGRFYRLIARLRRKLRPDN